MLNENPDLYLGIDPGKSGGFALVRFDGTVIRAAPFKRLTLHDLSDVLSNHSGRIRMACLEKVGAMPGQGVTSMFSFGENFGTWKGLLTAHAISYELITPQKWQKALSILPKQKKKGETGTDFKNRLKANAQRIFAGQGATITHATGDALLLAEYCRRVYFNPNESGAAI